MEKTAIIALGGNALSNKSQAGTVKDQFSNTRKSCLLYTSPSPRDVEESRMPSSA